MSHRKTSVNLINVSSVKTNNNQTPTNRKNSKSPFSNSKCCHQPNQQTVSYGELQIVLENLQTIKQKASAQVKILSEENSQLK